jgi:beta-barrel assembly-enhancing protease
MKYVGKLIGKNDNVSGKNPLLEFLRLVLLLLLVFITAYFILGMAADFFMARVRPGTETELGKLQLRKFVSPGSSFPLQDERINRILDKLLPYQDKRGLNYQGRFNPKDEINALSVIGGWIIIYSGAYDEFRDEKELAFILGHELGHFAHKDQLHALGRNYLLILATIAMAGIDGGLTDFIAAPLLAARMNYSRDQETAADLYGVDMVYKAYGTALPAITVSEKMTALTSGRKSSTPALFKTHPAYSDRLKAVRQYISYKKYKAD